MKTIEYPIQELVSIEMSKDKTWFVRYNEKHECFPQLRKKVKTKYGDGWRLNKKGYMDFVFQTIDFCAKNYFTLEGEGYGLVGKNRRELVSWDNKEVMGYDLPRLLFPSISSLAVSPYIQPCCFPRYPAFLFPMYPGYLRPICQG